MNADKDYRVNMKEIKWTERFDLLMVVLYCMTMLSFQGRVQQESASQSQVPRWMKSRHGLVGTRSVMKPIPADIQ